MENARLPLGPTEPIELWLCYDCVQVEEIGRYDSMDDKRVAEVEAALAKLKAQGHLANNTNSETGEGQNEFSWRQCDCCQSNLGGQRERYALFLFPGNN